YDTTFYMADIQVSGVEYLKTAFANGTYGRNIKETTSDIAKDNNAIFAINGDYYGFRDDGYVVRNGILYRDTSGGNQDLVIDEEGDFSIINESQTDAQTLIDSGAWQVLSFGPSLINDGEIAVSADSEVDKSRTSNPRTAIGQVSELHYIIIVSDGRTDESAGLSLLQLAQELSDRGCTTAYNLDGGGSSTMWFNGQIINNPTDGRTDSERKVSDIVYFGY
ncbi:MAG: phosphodiester glycosidase family protein, partial [Oscillospiraceae bacterium]